MFASNPEHNAGAVTASTALCNCIEACVLLLTVVAKVER